jgi:hypothetical protein
MKFTIAHTYHEKHKKMSDIVTAYYEKLGYTVDRFQADFMEETEAHYRNEFFKRNKDSDYIIHLDSDEIITQEDMLKLTAILEKTKLDAYRCSIIDYLSIDYILKEKRIHKPIIAVKNNSTVKFSVNRNIKGFITHDLLPIDIHHIGYLTKEQTDFKINNYIARADHHELGNVVNVLNSELAEYKTPIDVETVIVGVLRG